MYDYLYLSMNPDDNLFQDLRIIQVQHEKLPLILLKIIETPYLQGVHMGIYIKGIPFKQWIALFRKM